MGERGDLMMILDNSMYSINKDYSEERLACQVNAAKRITESRLNASPESTVGVMTLGRGLSTKIVSPTNDKKTICSYLCSIERDEHIFCGDSISIARMALKYRTSSAQAIIMFLCAPLDDMQLIGIVDSVNESLTNGVSVRVILFGESLEYYGLLKGSIEETSEFTCVRIDPGEDFSEGISTALREGVQEVDPELELAIRRSLQDMQ